MKKIKSILIYLVPIIIIILSVVQVKFIRNYELEEMIYNKIMIIEHDVVTEGMLWVSETADVLVVLLICLSLFIHKRTRKDYALPVRT